MSSDLDLNMKAIIIASRNNFLEKKLVVELEKKIQAVGFEVSTEPKDASVAVVVNDGRDWLKDEQKKLKQWLKTKTKVTPHKLLATYTITDLPVPETLTNSSDFVTKEEYSLIGCLKDYWYFTHAH